MVSAYSEGSLLFVRVLPAACCNNRRAVPYKSLELASVHISQWLGQRTQGSGKQPNFSARLQQYRGCAWEMGLLFNCESNERLIEERRKEVQFRGVEESYWSCFSKCWWFYVYSASGGFREPAPHWDYCWRSTYLCITSTEQGSTW